MILAAWHMVRLEGRLGVEQPFNPSPEWSHERASLARQPWRPSVVHLVALAVSLGFWVLVAFVAVWIARLW
jgi:hypothetical protein